MESGLMSGQGLTYEMRARVEGGRLRRFCAAGIVRINPDVREVS